MVKGKTSEAKTTQGSLQAQHDKRQLHSRPGKHDAEQAPPLPVRTPLAPPIRNFDPYVLRVGTTSISLDPSQATDARSHQLLRNLYEGLTRLRDDGTGVEGAAATSWEVSEDQLEWRFTLRSDAQWSNGEPLTADDFVDSWRHLVDPETDSAYAWLLTELIPIKYGPRVSTGRLELEKLGVHSDGDHVLVVKLVHPLPFLPEVVSFPALYPVHSSVREEEPEEIVTNGVWRVAEIGEGTLTLEPSAHHRLLSEIDLKQVTLRAFEDDTAILAAYESGSLDFTGPLKLELPDNASDLQRDPMYDVYMLVFDTSRPPFDEPAPRQAVASLLARDSLLADLPVPARGGRHLVSTSSVPEYIPMPYSLPGREEARASLAEIEEEPLVMDLQQAGPVADRLARWLEEIGLHGKPPDEENSRPHMRVMGWWADYPDPSTMLTLFQSDHPLNVGKWKNDEYDTLLEAAMETSDRKARWEAYAKAEALLLEAAPVIPLYHLDDAYLVRPEVDGVRANAMGVHRFEDIVKRP